MPKTVAAVLSLVYLALVTRTLGAQNFGHFALIFSFAQMVVVLSSFQTWQIMLRYGSAIVQRADRDALARLTMLCIALDLGALVLGAAISVAALVMFGAGLGWSNAEQWLVLAFTMLLIIASRATTTGLLRINDQFRSVAFAETLVPLIRLVGTVAVIMVAPSIWGFLGVWLVSELVPAIMLWVIALRRVPLRITRANMRMISSASDELPDLWHFTGWTKLNTLVSPQLVVVFVGYWVGALYAGFFRLGDQLGQVLARISDAVAFAVFAEYARVTHGETEGRVEAAHAIVAKTARTALLSAAILMALLVIGGKALLGFVFGPEFVPAYPYLLFLAGAAAVRAAALGFEPALQAQGQARTATLCNLIGAVVFFVGFFAVVPQHGSLGAAAAVFASAIAAATALALSYWRMARRLGAAA